METAPENVNALDYGFRITAKRNENGTYSVDHNGNAIGVYSSFFLADQVACGIRRACWGITACDVKSDWWKSD
jgi:hypothetical protein